MAYPYPTVNKPRATVHTCILPHKLNEITTYQECVAAMQGCRDVAMSRYNASGDARQAQYSQLFHAAAFSDRLGTVNTTQGNAWDYAGVCKTLLTPCSRNTLWPTARNTIQSHLTQFHNSAAAQPTAQIALGAQMSTVRCMQRADGRLQCSQALPWS